MSHECHHGSCSDDHHIEHSNGCCCCNSHHHCGCSCHHGSHKYSDELLALADKAWMEVVKDSIKEEIIKHSGKHIAKMASLVAETNHLRWKHKLDEKDNHDAYEAELRKLISPKD